MQFQKKLKVGNKLLFQKIKCSVLRKAISIATAQKFTKILFQHCQIYAWWQSSDDKIYHETHKKRFV